MSEAFLKWLDSVQCTRPFTLDDARALYRLIHERLVPENVKVDVYTTGSEVVLVRVETKDKILVRMIDVV